MSQSRRFAWCASLLLSFVHLATAATYTVTSNANTGGLCPSASNCTLRAAIATATSGSDTIVFDGDMTITLASSLSLTTSVTIDASDNAVVLDGNNAVEVLIVGSPAIVRIIHLTIQHGSSGIGGGVLNSGDLTFTNSTFANNAASFDGGAISNGGTLTLIDSTFSHNTVARFGGAIVCSSGSVTAINGTFSNNAAPGGQVNGGKGGAFFNESGCTVTLTNTTFSGNSALNQGGGIYNNAGTLTLNSSTLSGNIVFVTASNIVRNAGTVNVSASIADGGCSGTITDHGGNIDTGTSCAFTQPTSQSSVANLNLGALADNDGPTQTMLPAAGSAAINAIACTGLPLVDQRDYIRPDPDSAASATACDVGAVEAGSIPDEIFLNGFE